MNKILIILTFAILVYCNENVTVPVDELEVKIYYEALCIDSMIFFRRKLIPSMVNNNRLKNTNLKLIPYGKVDKYLHPTTNNTELLCQHGPRECELNALHACIIENYNVSDALLLIGCLMNDYNSDIDSCGNFYHLDIQLAKNCTTTRNIPEILNKYGDETDLIQINFVPSIAIDEKFDHLEQYRLRTNFDTIFCRKFTAKYNYTLPKCP